MGLAVRLTVGILGFDGLKKQLTIGTEREEVLCVVFGGPCRVRYTGEVASLEKGRFGWVTTRQGLREYF